MLEYCDDRHTNSIVLFKMCHLNGDIIHQSSSQAKAPRLDNSQTDAQSQNESQSQSGTPSQLPTMSTVSTPLHLAGEVIWHYLRPFHYVSTSTKDMSEQVYWKQDQNKKILVPESIQLTGRSV